jgi:mRNA interferase MazF
MVCLESSSENGLSKRSAVDTFQIRSVSEIRLLKQIGVLSEMEMLSISSAMTIVLGL